MFPRPAESEVLSNAEMNELQESYKASLKELGYDKEIIVHICSVLIANSTPSLLEQYRNDFNIKNKKFEEKIQGFCEKYSTLYATDTETIDKIDDFKIDIKCVLKAALLAQLKVGHESISNFQKRSVDLIKHDQRKDSLAFHKLFDDRSGSESALDRASAVESTEMHEFNSAR